MYIKEYIEQLPKRAVIRRGDGSFTVFPRIRQGKMLADQLIAVAGAVEEYGLQGVRLNAGQRLVIDGVSEDVLPEFIEKIGPVGDLHKHVVQACLGNTGCKLGMQDSMGVAVELEEYIKDHKLPMKLKSSASGCSMCCAESMVRDVGLIGRKNGWIVTFGGNAGKNVRQADVLAKDVSTQEAFEIIGKALDFYAENAKVKERTARFVERVGIEALKSAVFGK